MTTSVQSRRVAVGLSIAMVALSGLAGCDRRQPDGPDPTPGAPTPRVESNSPGRGTNPDTSGQGMTTPNAMPSASAASR